MPFFDIIVLANSFKRRGRCIAGIRTDGGGWIRLVAQDTDSGELYPDHYIFDDGSEPQPLDVIRVHCDRPNPKPHHPEDWVVGPEFWDLLHRPIPAALLPRLRQSLQRGGPLLGDSASQVASEYLVKNPVANSLALISPFEFECNIVSTAENKCKPRMRFSHGPEWYDLPVTDPAWMARVRELPPGRHSSAAAGIAKGQRILLTISLSEEYMQTCYKLIAAVIPVETSWAAPAVATRLAPGRAEGAVTGHRQSGLFQNVAGLKPRAD